MATITEDYCSKEICQILMQKGFNEPCRARYDHNGILYYEKYPVEITGAEMHNSMLCPTLQMTMKWLRDAHKMFISIIYESEGVFVANLKIPSKGVDVLIDRKHNCWLTYEEAASVAIMYCLENLI